MSGIERGQANGRLGRLWQTWRFHLAAAAIAVPVAAFPGFYADQLRFSGVSGLGAREAGSFAVGPFDLTLAEFTADAPLDGGVAGDRKQFILRLCAGCDARIRAVYARIGKPRSLRAAGALFSGSPGRMFVDIPIPPGASVEDALWLTVEEWDGAVHMGSVPLESASPATAAWLRKKETTG